MRCVHTATIASNLLTAYSQINDSVTHIIHNAWAVNFNYSLKSFEGLIAGARKVIDFAASLDRIIKVFFTSSVGVGTKWNPDDGPVPEDIILDAQVATVTGYAASKYVVERVSSVLVYLFKELSTLNSFVRSSPTQLNAASNHFASAWVRLADPKTRERGGLQNGYRSWSNRVSPLVYCPR